MKAGWQQLRGMGAGRGMEQKGKEKKLMDIGPQCGDGEREEVEEGIRGMNVMEGDLTWGGEHTI